MHHVHCDCLAPHYWEYYPNIRLRYIGHPCHSSDFWRTPKPKLSSKRNRNLAAVWGLKEHNLYLKLEKCIFDQTRIEFLGVILEGGTVQMDPAKVKGVADWPPPQNVTDIHSFLGFTGFYHYFIPNYSLITQPLIQLMHKNVPFTWDPSCM